MGGDHNHHKSAKDFQGQWPPTRDSFLFTDSSLPLCWFRGLPLLFNFYLKIISYSIFWSYALPSPTPPWFSSPQYPSNFMFFLSQERKKKNQNKQTKNNEMKPTKSMKSILYWPTTKGLVTPIMFVPLLSWIIVYIPRDILLEKTGGCHSTPCMPQLQTAS